MIYDNRQFYIDGAWVDPAEAKEFKVINPATEEVAGIISMGGPKDVERAVAAARRAFDGYSRTRPAERLALLERVLAAYNTHFDAIAEAICTEMGAPISLAKGSQTRIGVGHISAMIEVLKTFKFEEPRGTTRLVQEPVGVCALITPWNWPMNQVAAKVVPALAAGCTMVLKPSEYSPFSAMLWAKVMHEAGVPAGVFNLINGDGPGVGAPLSSHPEIDMVSFTGSTRAGTEVAKNAAASVKRVHQELGGKSPNVLLDDADLERAVKHSVLHVFQNSGQSCNAPTRMLVPASKLAEVEAIARRVTAERRRRGSRNRKKPRSGRVVSEIQFERVEGYIEKGIAEGAKLVVGGSGRPGGPDQGLLRQADDFFGRAQRHDHRARGDFRTGAVHPAVRDRGAGRADRQRHALRTRGLRVVEGQRARAPRRQPHPRRPGGFERRVGRHADAVRRLQDVRQRARVG